MKKVLSCFVALLAAISMYATELNIYASGLKATTTATVPSKTTIDYVLNAPATSLNVKLYDNSTLVATIPVPAGNENANYAKGSHTGVAIDLSEVANGTYTWKMEASQDAVVASLTEVTSANDKYRYYLPQDVAVDNSFESPYFGRIYVSESMRGLPDGGTTTTQDQTRGLYIYNPYLTFVDGQTAALVGYDGNIGGTTGVYNTKWADVSGVERHSFKRIAIDNAGYVYVASRDAANMGVYRMDPANPSANFVKVLNATRSIDAVGIVNNTLFTAEASSASTPGVLNAYSLSNIPVGDPTASLNSLSTAGLANGDCDAAPDGRGGWWFSQNRWHKDTYPCLSHIKSDGTRDYAITDTENSALLSQENNASYRGVVAVSPDGKLVALGSDKKAIVFSITYDAQTEVPTLEEVYRTGTIGGNIDGLAFDVANNFYVVSASKERFLAYATPKAAGENTFTTPAPTTQQITVNNVEQLYEIGSNQDAGFVANSGSMMVKVSGNVFKYEGFFAADTYLAFVTDLAQTTDQGGWDYVNARRFAGDVDHKEVTNGSNIDLNKNAYDIHVTTAGYYTVIVDFNREKISFTSIPEKVELIASWNNWEPVLMTNDAGDLTCSVTLTMTPDKYDGLEGRTGGFKVRINDDDDWMGSIETIKRVMPTTDRKATLNDATIGHNCGLWIDIPGEYTFTYTYASKEMHVDYPYTFTRSGASTNYQTLCVPFTADVTNAEVFTVGTDAVNGNYVTLTPCSASGLTRGASYIIKPDGSGNDVVITMPGGTTTPDPYVPATPITRLYGQLSATYTYVHDADPTWTVYVLGDDNMFHLISTGASATVTSTRAYLHIEGGSLAPEVRIIEQGNDATDIQSIEAQEKAVKFYMNGQIYIQKDGVVYDVMGRIIR